MAQWIAVPKCPSCGTPMRPDDDEDLWQCPDCWLSASKFDLEYLYTDDDDEEDEDDEF